MIDAKEPKKIYGQIVYGWCYTTDAAKQIQDLGESDLQGAIEDDTVYAMENQNGFQLPTHSEDAMSVIELETSVEAGADRAVCCPSKSPGVSAHMSNFWSLMRIAGWRNSDANGDLQ